MASVGARCHARTWSEEEDRDEGEIRNYFEFIRDCEGIRRFEIECILRVS